MNWKEIYATVIEEIKARFKGREGFLPVYYESKERDTSASLEQGIEGEGLLVVRFQ